MSSSALWYLVQSGWGRAVHVIPAHIGSDRNHTRWVTLECNQFARCARVSLRPVYTAVALNLGPLLCEGCRRKLIRIAGKD